MSAILIVDDSLTVRMDLVEALDTAGFRSVPAANLAEARSALAGHTVALAILDVLLPDGDGVAFLEELRADPRYTELPVLMLSTEAEVKDRIRGLRTGANDYIGKPYDTAAMIDRIRQLIGSSGSTPDRLVVVIDDSATFRAAIVEALGRAGYATAEAASGPEGLRIAASQRPAAIIVDGSCIGPLPRVARSVARPSSGSQPAHDVPVPCLNETASGSILPAPVQTDAPVRVRAAAARCNCGAPSV